MMVEDFMPNKTSTVFDFAQKQKPDKEEQAIKEASGVLFKILARLDERILFYRSIDAIDDGVLSDSKLLAETITVNKLTATNLSQEREAIQALIDKI